MTSIDQFEEYYTEKLWEAIPEIYRHEDGLSEKPGVLRAIVSVLATQAAVLRRSQDRLWDDQFIDLCEEWAVPYIGELVATRLLSALNPRGRRVDVAKTIYYRRRKGTPRILEELISDISGWDGKMVEQFRRLARSRHGLDALPGPLAGKYSGTMPGGWADLRNQRESELASGPFEEFFHTPDVRRYSGMSGRYAIPKLAFYLYRLRAFEAIAVTPFALGDGRRFGFDPSGRETPLFSKPATNKDWNQWHSAAPAEIPGPISCRLLGNGEYVITAEIIRTLTEQHGLAEDAGEELMNIAGLRFAGESRLYAFINTFSHAAEILDDQVFLPLLSLSIEPGCAKSILLPDIQAGLEHPLDSNSIVVGFADSETVITTEHITAASLVSWPFDIEHELAIDPEKGLFMFREPVAGSGELFIASHYGFSGSIGAGTYERPWIDEFEPDVETAGGGALSGAALPVNGIIRIDDSKTYGPVDDVTGIGEMTIQAGNGRRPYIRLESDWLLGSDSNLNSKLTLDGLWIGAAGDTNAGIILEGDFEFVIIRNCTIDPGGSSNLLHEELLPVRLSVQGRVGKLCIESAMTGPVCIEGNGIVEELFIDDSIVQSVNVSSVKALEIDTGKSVIQRSTVFGDVVLHRLEASEALFTGLVTITNVQEGCFRFSAACKASTLPRPYESFLFFRDSRHWFTSRRFGDPGYGQLSDTAPEQLRRGAENGSEMGVFSNLLNSVKTDGLQSKVNEYMPFGMIPVFIHQT